MFSYREFCELVANPQTQLHQSINGPYWAQKNIGIHEENIRSFVTLYTYFEQLLWETPSAKDMQQHPYLGR
jgi:hypothetical protein